MIKSWVESLVGDGSVYRLISSFLSLTVFENLGGIHVYTSSGGSAIPPAGDITRVLLDIALQNLFDSQFPKGFPGIAFHRFINEVYDNAQLTHQFSARRSSSIYLPNFGVRVESTGNNVTAFGTACQGLDDLSGMSSGPPAFLASSALTDDKAW
ncbi:hypothetical protein FXO38_22225 [Capsicum annuum]|nr:hypothetical protein FXO38_22225 [Capsicum annuum]KAF3659359.1 hypothetical protein FXO37_14013 [Capsicum annuum]